MSFYDGNLTVGKKLIAEAQASPAFRELDASTETVKQALLNTLPLLQKDGSKIDWMAAFDYFACRKAHGLAVSAELESLSDEVTEIVAKRFSLYFSNAEHLNQLTAPLLRDLNASIARIVEHSNTAAQSSPGLVVFSGHDVNILGLLYAIEADKSVIRPPFWPDYGSNVIFEVVESTSQADSRSHNRTEKIYNLNSYFNLKPIDILSGATSRRIKDVCSTTGAVETEEEQRKDNDNIGVSAAALRPQLTISDFSRLLADREKKLKHFD